MRPMTYREMAAHHVRAVPVPEGVLAAFRENHFAIEFQGRMVDSGPYPDCDRDAVIDRWVSQVEGWYADPRTALP